MTHSSSRKPLVPYLTQFMEKNMSSFDEDHRVSQ